MPTRNTDGSPRHSQPFSTLCATAGTELARVRIARGITVNDVADRLLLSPRQVEALEDGDTNSFHSASYYLTALRRYAAFAEIDSALVTKVGDAMRTIPAGAGAGVIRASATAAAALLVIAAISASVWWFTRTPAASVASGADAPAPIPTIVFSQDPSSPSVQFPVANSEPTAGAHAAGGSQVVATTTRTDAAATNPVDATATESKAADTKDSDAKSPDTKTAGNTNATEIKTTDASASSVADSAGAAGVTGATSAANAGSATRQDSPRGSVGAKPLILSGAFGTLRVHDSTWVLVRDANDSVVGRTLPADSTFSLDSAPTYLAVGTPNVDLFVGSHQVDIADYVVNGQIEMRTRDFTAVAERAGETSVRR